MKSHITVIISKDTNDLETALKNALEPHRLDDDDLNSIKSHHWDYWFLPDGQDFNDAEISAHFPDTNPDILKNASYIKNLLDRYATSGIVDLSGKWFDLQDFGWTMLNQLSQENKLASEKWKEQQKKILAENVGHIAIQVITHC